jgi:hypothetical protein
VAIVLGQRRNIAGDLPLSLLVHGGIAAIVLAMRLPAPETVDPRPAIAFWLTSPLRSVPLPAENVPSEPATELARSAPSQADVRRPVRSERPSARREQVPTEAPTEAPPSAPSAVPPRQIDWERERREALAQLRGQRDRTPRYAKFSGDDFVAPSPQPRDPVPTGEIFSQNTQAPSLLALGEQRTRFGRKVAELCHALTGGFGVSLQGHSLFSLCAASDGRSDLFATIKPDYLKLVPDCATDLPPEAAAKIPSALIRCRLVSPDDETAELEP